MMVTLLIPCHDERDAIAPLMAELVRLPKLLGPRHFVDVVFVDDGSTDATPKILQAHADRVPLPIRILGLTPNQGIGAAIREGAALCTGDAVVTYDADRPYPIEDVSKLLDVLERDHDVVTASPWHPEGTDDVGLRRRLVSRAASGLYRIRLGRRGRGLHTFTCGFRAYRREMLQKSLPRRNGFVSTAELLLNAIKNGARVAEVPSRLRTRTEGRSKMKTLRTTCAHLGLLLRG